jgi:uncharacterized phage protein (TIGR01671 family)
MREIKFRAKRLDNNEWVYGYLIKGERTYIATKENIYNMVVSASYHTSFDLIEVDSETVGQYTGLKDKNGKEIYEGDICNVHVFIQELGENMGVVEGEKEFVAEICFDCICGVSVKNNKGDSGPLYMYGGFEESEEQLEVIGNIYENKELLK